MIATGSNRQQLVEENENYKKKKDKRKELAGSRPVSNRWVNACPRHARRLRRLRVTAGRVDSAAARHCCSLNSPQPDATMFKNQKWIEHHAPSLPSLCPNTTRSAAHALDRYAGARILPQVQRALGRWRSGSDHRLHGLQRASP